MRSPQVGPRSLSALFGALALTLAGCSDELALPVIGSLQYEGVDFDVWASDGRAACGGTYQAVEAWLAAFRLRVGDAGIHERHRFYWVSEADSALVPCPDAPACAYVDERVIYSPWVPQEHEIVHLELGDREGPSLLTEGAAELFGSTDSSAVVSTFPVNDVLDVWPIPGTTYQTAGRFSAYLAETYGLDTYLDLMKVSSTGRGEQDLRAAFDSVLPVSLDDALTSFEAEPACTVSRWRFHDHECGELPLVPWESSGRWEQTIALDCASDDVIGPRPSHLIGGLDEFEGGSPDEIWSIRALEIPELDGPYRFSIESDDAAHATLEPCFAHCFDQSVPLQTRIQPSPFARVGAAFESLIPAGRYWLRVSHDASSSASVKVVIEPSED